QVEQAGADDQAVKQQVDADDHHGQADHLAEAAEERRPQDDEQQHGDGELLARQGDGVGGDGPVNVGDQVLGGVGGGEGVGDDEVGGGEAEQDQDEELAAPAVDQPLQHGDGALAAERLPGHVAVDRQGAEKRDRDQDHRGQRRQPPGGVEGDRRL